MDQQRRQNLTELRQILGSIEESIGDNVGKKGRKLEEAENEKKQLLAALQERDAHIAELNDKLQKKGNEYQKFVQELSNVERRFDGQIARVEKEKQDLEMQLSHTQAAMQRQRQMQIDDEFDDVDDDNRTAQVHMLQRKLMVSQDELGSKEITLKMLEKVVESAGKDMESKDYEIEATNRSLESNPNNAQLLEKKSQLLTQKAQRAEAMVAEILAALHASRGPTRVGRPIVANANANASANNANANAGGGGGERGLSTSGSARGNQSAPYMSGY